MFLEILLICSGKVASTVVDKEELEHRLMRANDAISEAQAFQSFYAKRYHYLIEFNVADLVLLSAQHIQTLFCQEWSQTAESFVGPYKVNQRIRHVAHCLEILSVLKRLMRFSTLGFWRLIMPSLLNDLLRKLGIGPPASLESNTGSMESPMMCPGNVEKASFVKFLINLTLMIVPILSW